MINGFTALCLTKLDTLDELAEIKVATTYKRNGIELPNFPGKKIQINFWFCETRTERKVENLNPPDVTDIINWNYSSYFLFQILISQGLC